MVLLVATHNPGKVEELRVLCGSILTLRTLEGLDVPEVIEDQPTLALNAEKKARAAAMASGLWSLGDDSGLFVHALDGAPGVYSARYAPTVEARRARLLAALHGVVDRSAHFACALALSSPEGVVALAEGRLDGAIAHAPRGEHGFGFDPLFVLPDGRTLAELDPRETARVSHRAVAFRALLPALTRLAHPAGNSSS